MVKGMEGTSRRFAEILHPGVVRIERELTWSAAGWEHVVIVVTDVPVDPAQTGHDPAELHAIAESVSQDLKRKGQGFSRLTIRNRA